MTYQIDLPLKRLDPKRPPVVLMGGINLVRSLGLAGIPAIVASPDPDEPAFASRYCIGRCVLPSLDKGGGAVDALMAVGDRIAAVCGRRVPLMYGSDDALEFIYTHRERLQRFFLVMLSDAHVGDALIAKDRFQKLAESRGLPVPRALTWSGHGPGSLAGTPGEVLVKPSIKVDWHHSQLCQRLFDGDGKARVFESGPKAAAHPVVGLFHDQLTFQEYIPGDDRDLWSYHGFADERGNVLASFIGRKVRTFPTSCGESAFIELAHEESLAELGRDVAKRCPLKGVFKMDFKRDPRDGSWHLLEINARYNLWHYLGAANGINLMRVAYDYLVNGTTPEATSYEQRYRWLSMSLDFKAYREMAARGELGAAAWLKSIVFSRNIFNMFSWSDPGPWLRFWKARFARLFDRRAGRMMAVLRQWRSTAS